jgi:hypothetical protein
MERIRFGTGMLLLGVTLGTSLAFGFVAGAQAIGRSMVAMRESRTIKVKGTSAEDLASDRASWAATVSVQAPTLKEAYALLERDAGKLAAFLASRGFPDATLARSSVSADEIRKVDANGNRTNVVEAWRLTQRFGVASNDCAAVAAIARDATSLIRDGVEITSLPPVYTKSDIEAVKLRLLAAATDNGRERAETLAKGARGSLTKLVSASQGVFQIVAKDSTDSSDYGVYDTSTVAKTAKAVVTLEFEIER